MTEWEWKPRKFQEENRDLARAIQMRQSPVRTILNIVTPGGGKSTIPVIYAAHLIPRVIDKIAWFTPRDALRTQGEEVFQDENLQRWLGHNFKIRACGNETDPSRGLQGYVSTHQALGQDPGLHASEFKRHRYALFIDECHHLEADSDLARAAQVLADHAALVVLMTGTVGRGDRGRVAFLEYIKNEVGRETPIVESCSSYEVIRYTRGNALADHAILPIYFTSIDMAGKWERDGETITIDSFDDATPDDARDALATALATPYALDVLNRATKDWLGARRDNPFAQLLIVADSQATATKYQKALRDGYNVACGIAISDHGAAATAAIKAYRQRRSPAITSVAMAYEGMDAPGTSHLACLTYYRSIPWIEQMLARGIRVDRKAGPYASQRCYAYVPDDPIMRKVIAEIEAEQAPFLKEIREGPGVGPSPRDWMPLGGAMSGLRASELSGDSLNREATAAAQAVIDDFDMAGRIDVMTFTRMHAAWKAQPSSTAVVDVVELTPSEQEQKLKRGIQKFCNQVDKHYNDCQWGTMNGHLVRMFGKSREVMRLDELKRAKSYLEKTYPEIAFEWE